MRRALLVGVGVAAISFATAPSAGADTQINTTPSWNGSNSASFFGYPNTATYGQTVTAPATDTTLDSFTFYMKQPTSVLFRGEVYAWDDTTQRATGSALYQSAATQTTSSTVFQPITFNTGGINLTAGSKYILFASVSKDYAANSGAVRRGAWGFVGSDVYSGGGFFFQNNIPNGGLTGSPDRWTTDSWSVFTDFPFHHPHPGWDLAFKANFVPFVDNDLRLSGTPENITTDATSPAGAVVTYIPPVATDEVPETPLVSCDHASGSTFAIDTTTTVTCTATDSDDTNSPVTTTFNVHVKGAAEQLSDLANAVTGVGPGTSLADKVASVQSSLAANDTSDACGTLNAFINEVNAQTPKHIDADQAASLIEAAQRIEAVIPCTS